jgi:ketosteroid isomerase-like protein
MPTAITTPEDEVYDVVRQINAAWTSGRVERLGNHFHENIVIVHPDCQGRTTGKAACVKSYEEFISRAIVREYNEGAPTVDLWNDTAICTYPFDIEYEMNGARLRESGHDVFAFVRENGRWLAVWRMMQAKPATS